LQYDLYNGEKIHFIISCINNVVPGERDIEWKFLVDGTYREGLFPGISGERVLVKKALPGKSGWKLWYDWQIPLLVKKLKPSLVMTTGGIASKGLKTPQCLWMPERAAPGDWVKKKPYSGLYIKRLSDSLRLAQVLFTFSEKDKAFLSQLAPGPPYPLPQSISDKIEVMYGAADKDFTSLSWVEKEKIKVAYAAGKEYFLTAIPAGNGEELVELLKAFSRFKKRQQSNMQLVLTGGPGAGDIDPGGKLDTYKYRSDVHICNPVPASEWKKLVAASYAFVTPFNRDGLGLDVLNAFKASVPVITTSRGCLPEITGDAALFAEVSDTDLLASQLMLLYKDEHTRGELIGKGEARTQAFSWQTPAEKLWKRIAQIVKKG
jgi:hypothetical protein